MARTETVLLEGTTAERLGWQVVSAAIGLGASVAIFFGLAWVQHERPAALPEAVEDLHAVALPVQPPPPPERTEEQLPTFDDTSIQLAASRSPDSVIKLPAAPIPSDSVPPVRAIPRFDVSPGTTKPAVDILDREPQHIFSRAEVDERPIPIFRKNPDVTQTQINAMRKMRASFLMVAGIDGSVTTVNLVDSCGNKEVDEACIAALREWRFKPAVKKGRQVRCWVQQNLIFKVTKTSPFEYREP